MMNKLIYLLIAQSFIAKAGYSQVFGHADSLSEEKSEFVIKKNFKNPIKSKYLLFSISDKWFLIIIKKTNNYDEYYISADSLKSSKNDKNMVKNIKNNPLLFKAFEKKRYKKGYITFNSSFYKNKHVESEGNITYFYLMINGVKYGEARLSVLIKPNPIEEDIYDYLRINLLKYISR